MTKGSTLVCVLLCVASVPALGRGVSPYLPLSIDPDIERQIERVLVLADKPALTRPIPAALVLDALPRACGKDARACDEVRRYLKRFMGTFDVTDASLEGAVSSGARKTASNQFGMPVDSPWEAMVRGYYQPFDHALVSVGAVAYDGRIVPSGSMVSVGFSAAQLDLGYRDHWWSPMSDSAMLISTEAATMPSVTLSNYVPFTRFGVHYEAFLAAMSHSDNIRFGDGFTSGRPRLAGFHASMEPASGWALGVNRLFQYGGGERPGSLSDLLHGFLSPSKYDNTNPNLTSDQQLGNQVASITSEFIFPGRVPFSVYFEYSGEDTSAGKDYLLGNAALSAGIYFPKLWGNFDLTYEVSEWQNEWYVNNVYGDGLTNKGNVIGHWGADERLPGDSVGAQSHMLRLGWKPAFGGLIGARLRTLENQTYGRIRYERTYEGALSYSRPLNGFTVGAEVLAGRDVFGKDFSRAAAFVRYSGDTDERPSALEYDPTPADKTASIYVEAGVAANSVKIDLDGTHPFTRSNTGAHLGIGARRAVSDRSDLGARLELDDVDSHTLLSVRVIDYRYRFDNPLALSVFVGASRYDLATPAYGLYFGAGVQWRDVLPGWDAGVDVRNAKKVARDHVFANDPSSALRPDSFYTVQSVSLSITKRF